MPRNVMDVYVPACASVRPETKNSVAGDNTSLVSTSGRPIALFCHGGVWASGANLSESGGHTHEDATLLLRMTSSVWEASISQGIDVASCM